MVEFKIKNKKITAKATTLASEHNEKLIFVHFDAINLTLDAEGTGTLNLQFFENSWKVKIWPSRLNNTWEIQPAHGKEVRLMGIMVDNEVFLHSDGEVALGKVSIPVEVPKKTLKSPGKVMAEEPKTRNKSKKNKAIVMYN